MNPRPWYRWYPVTWGVLVVLATALGYCQVAQLGEYGWRFGWPLLGSPWDPWNRRFNANLVEAAVVFNLLVALIMLAATTFVVERIRRGAGEHAQLRLRTAFVVIAVAAGVLFLIRLEAVQRLIASLDAFVLLLNLLAWLAVAACLLFAISRLVNRPPAQRRLFPIILAVIGAGLALAAMQFIRDLLAYNRYTAPQWNPHLDQDHWYVAGPILLGIGCTIYTAGWLAVYVGSTAKSLLGNRREPDDVSQD